MFEILVILAALTALMMLAYYGGSVLLLAPALAVAAAAATGGMPLLATYTQLFMTAAGGFIIAFFPLFLLGAVFGRLMDDSGAARVLADWITRRVGEDKAILSVVLACAALTYGGISLFVVAFAAWPLARALFARTDTPARLAPATIALGAFTFTMTALPGTPAIQNIIPTRFFGTDAFAAPGLGVIVALVMLGLGQLWLSFRASRLRAAGERSPDLGESDGPDGPPVWAAATPVIAVLVFNAVLGIWWLPSQDLSYLSLPEWGSISPGQVTGIWAIIAALSIACVLALLLHRSHLSTPVTTLDEGGKASLLPIFNTASLVGFGAVIASLAGFAIIRDGLTGLSDWSVLVSLSLAVNVLAGITGSASGGMSIALDTLGETYLTLATTTGISPELLHRVTAVATGGLDALPHNGAVVTLLGICGMTHKEAYGDIFMVAVLIPLIALAVLIVLGSALGSF
ncbi:MAG: GntP family permease [Pseudomonadota bacterium]